MSLKLLAHMYIANTFIATCRLERVKRLLKENGSSFAGIAADIELAKHYAQKIPDPKWRNSLIGRSEKFSEKLHGMRSLRGNGESQNAQ